MTTAAILHDTAMEYYDFGKIAQAKGETAVYENYLQKAYMISKEAALRGQIDRQDSFWKYVYLRSTAHLALEYGRIDEARQFTQLGLSSLPPQSEKMQLEKILNKIDARHPVSSTAEMDGNHFSLGTLVSIDLESSLAKVKDINSKDYHLFQVPIEQIEQVARLYLGDLVKVFTTYPNEQPLPLHSIQLAA
jgi:hypothetical protein